MEEIIQDFERVCKHCGKDISEKQKKQVFCSKQCANEYNVKSPNHAANNRKNIWTCKRCGKEFYAPKDRSTYCSRECAFAYRKEHKAPEFCRVYFKTCDICGRLFTDKRKPTKHSLCSKECRGEHHRRYTRACYRRICAKEYVCVVCGVTFTPEYGDKRRSFCSDVCRVKKEARDRSEHRKKNPDLRRRWNHKRRALKRNAFVEPVNLSTLFDRDAGRCKICGRKLNLIRKVPHPLSATIDHIVPLCLGGLHEYKNTQLVCFGCNSKKGGSFADGGDQLLLFGT